MLVYSSGIGIASVCFVMYRLINKGYANILSIPEKIILNLYNLKYKFTYYFLS